MTLTYPAMDPVAIHLGPLPVRWYSLAYLAGFLLGWRYALYLVGRDPQGRIRKEAIDDFLVWAVIGVIAGGRIGYVLFYQAGLYLHDPLEVLRLWDGGMSFHGGAIGVITAMIVYAARYKLPLLRLTDIICCTVPIGLFFGRIANFINGELIGRVTDAPWGMVFPRGGDMPRHPSQLYESGLEGLVLGLLLAVLVHIKGVRDRPGILSGVFLAGYAAARMTVEFFREPDPQLGFIFASFTMGQLLSVPMMLGGLGLALWAAVKNHDRS